MVGGAGEVVTISKRKAEGSSKVSPVSALLSHTVVVVAAVRADPGIAFLTGSFYTSLTDSGRGDG